MQGNIENQMRAAADEQFIAMLTLDHFLENIIQVKLDENKILNNATSVYFDAYRYDILRMGIMNVTCTLYKQMQPSILIAKMTRACTCSAE